MTNRISLPCRTNNTPPVAQEKNIWVSRLVNVAKKVIAVASFMFITTASVLFYLANPSLFALGFIVGLVIDEKVRETVSKVKKICIAKPWVVPLVGIGAFLALPVAVAAGSFTCGAYVSSKIAGLVPPDYDPRTRIPQFIRKYCD